MFVSPLSTAEYLAALMISSIIKCAVVLIIVGFIVFYITGFNILKIGFLNIILDFTNLIIFSWSMGIILTGLIFRFGTRIQAMAWGAVFLFQPLSASFFPITILPKPIQIISYYIPATHVFVAARKNFTNPQTDWGLFFLAIGLNIIYFATSCLIFYLFYRKSLETGQFARNEG
jgi:ABC-2 type transport system permease protein